MTLIDGHSHSNYNDKVMIYAVHPSTGYKFSAVGQAFKVKTVGDKYKLTQIKVYLRRQAPYGATGHLRADLYNITGTYGTNAKPAGGVLASSQLVDISTLGVSVSEITFNFIGAQQYEMLKDNAYGFAIKAVDGNLEDGVACRMRKEGPPCETHDGNFFGFHNSAWDDNNYYDLCFLVYGELVSPPPPQDHKITMQTPVGEGSVVPSIGVHWYEYGTDVTLTATPTEGNEFLYWSITPEGGYSSNYSENPKHLIMTTNYTVKAYFQALPEGAGEWVSPTGFEDPDSKWSSETNAYDEDVGTRARTSIGVPPESWSGFLGLTHDEIASDRIRFYTYVLEEFTKIDIDVYNGEIWIHVYEGNFERSVWITKTFDMIKITKARVRFYNSATYAIETSLYEFDFWSIPPIPPPLLAVKLGSNLAMGVTGDVKNKFILLV